MTCNRETKWLSRILLLGWMMATLTAGPASAASDKTCITGSDPSVAADAAQIAALEAQIAATCPCASFDGSTGKGKGDYRKCVSPLIKTAIVNGQLRAKCKARIGKAHRLSSCGVIGAVPCIEKKGDRVRCRITTAEKCQSDSRYTRTACAGYARCVDAGDDNGDYLVDGSDSSECAMPAAATATATAAVEDTATPTLEPTHTPTVVPTDSPTAVPTDTPTENPTPTPTSTATATAAVEWTYCAAESGTCNTPAALVRFGANGLYFYRLFSEASAVACNTATFGDPAPGVAKSCEYTAATSTLTVCDSTSGVIPHVDVNLEDDPQSPALPPDARANNCPPQSLSGGGCKLNILEGTIPNVFDAGASIDLARCPGDPAPSFQWEIFVSPIGGGASYSSAGITGADSAVLTIQPDSMPSLQALSDPFWRMRLTITSNVSGQTSQTWFRFEYATTCTWGGC